MSGAGRRGVVFLLVATFLLGACGGSGGGGGTTTTEPPPPTLGFAFTPQGTPPADSLYLAVGAATTETTLVLELRTNQVTDLYGVAFDFTYPATQLQFTRVTAGPLLASGAVQAAASSPGTLIVGGTHLGATPGASGSGVLMTIEFSALASGQGSFAFARNSALTSTGAAVPGLTWLGGAVTVTTSKRLRSQ
ncbi:MAG TPA: cohesin domain-containing protein [Thermoanaerobaculia bacterium]|nr:cohesin domain-containing protein [Thermoanaerobaculia bacterium]